MSMSIIDSIKDRLAPSPYSPEVAAMIRTVRESHRTINGYRKRLSEIDAEGVRMNATIQQVKATAQRRPLSRRERRVMLRIHVKAEKNQQWIKSSQAKALDINAEIQPLVARLLALGINTITV